jgi:hypothetical protein
VGTGNAIESRDHARTSFLDSDNVSRPAVGYWKALDSIGLNRRFVLMKYLYLNPEPAWREL